jgi:recombination protein RecA
MSQALRKLTATVHKSNTTLFFINQIRMKIGVMFGSPETTTGGNALKFYSSVRLDIRRVGTIKVGEASVGNRTRVKVAKNKLAPPFGTCEFDILFGKGISRSGDIVDLASEAKIIDKAGAWFSYEGERIGQGRDNAVRYLEEHPDLLDKIETKLFEAKGLKRSVASAAPSEDAAPAKSKASAEDKRPRAKA